MDFIESWGLGFVSMVAEVLLFSKWAGPFRGSAVSFYTIMYPFDFVGCGSRSSGYDMALHVMGPEHVNPFTIHAERGRANTAFTGLGKAYAVFNG